MANEAARARAGATFMDATCVGWPEKIDADTLDLSSCDKCMFGQAFDDNFINVAINLGLNMKQAADLGFTSEIRFNGGYISGEECVALRGNATAEYAALRAAWLTEIALRLGTPEAEEARIEASPVDAGEVWGAL